MDMLTPIPSNAAPVMAVSPVTPAMNTGDRGDPRTGNSNGSPADEGEPAARTPPTTLRYKFDWLLQRQVNAGTLSADKAAAMIKLFSAAVGETETKTDEVPPAAPEPVVADAAAETTDREPEKPPNEAAAAQLVASLREQFTTEGPYDATGVPSAASPTGIVLDEKA